MANDIHTIIIIVCSEYVLELSQTDTPTTSQMTIKNKSTHTSLGCCQETTTEKERRQSRGYRNPRTGSLHQPDFINEQSAGDIDQVSKSQKGIGSSLAGSTRPTRSISSWLHWVTHQFLVEGKRVTSMTQLWDVPNQRGQHQDQTELWLHWCPQHQSQRNRKPVNRR